MLQLGVTGATQPAAQRQRLFLASAAAPSDCCPSPAASAAAKAFCCLLPALMAYLGGTCLCCLLLALLLWPDDDLIARLELRLLKLPLVLLPNVLPMPVPDTNGLQPALNSPKVLVATGA